MKVTNQILETRLISLNIIEKEIDKICSHDKLDKNLGLQKIFNIMKQNCFEQVDQENIDYNKSFVNQQIETLKSYNDVYKILKAIVIVWEPISTYTVEKERMEKIKSLLKK